MVGFFLDQFSACYQQQKEKPTQDENELTTGLKETNKNKRTQESQIGALLNSTQLPGLHGYIADYTAFDNTALSSPSSPLKSVPS